MRHLAQIRKINKLIPIEGADAIELARVDGWNVVVKKGEYEVGDLAIYFEIDSWVPHSLAPFLSKGSVPKSFNGVEGARLKTVKLRGALSQGLLLPVENVPSELRSEGQDVTEALGVQKWEPPEDFSLQGAIKSQGFPYGIPKTDAERIQNIKKLPYGEAYQVSLKLDGTSCTLLHDPETKEVRVFSRSIEYKLHDPVNDNNVYCIIGRRYEKNVQNLPRGFAVRGEIMGPRIQGNRENLKNIEFFVFDMWDAYSENPGYIPPASCLSFCQENGFTHVPVLINHWILKSSFTEQDILDWADDTKSINNPVAEGLVFKSVEGSPDNSVEYRFKAISNKFLLKKG